MPVNKKKARAKNKAKAANDPASPPPNYASTSSSSSTSTSSASSSSSHAALVAAMAVPSQGQKELAVEHTNRGTKVKNQNMLHEAMKLYQKALEFDPTYPVAWYNLGVCYAEQRMMEDAKRHYLEAVKYEPKFALPHNNLGAYFKDAGDLERSLHHYKLAIRANPKFAQALSNISVVYHMQGALGDAQRSAEQAVRVDPNNAEGFNNLGTMYLDEGRSIEACACFEKCLQLVPETAENIGAPHNLMLAVNFREVDFDEDEAWHAQNPNTDLEIPVDRPSASSKKSGGKKANKNDDGEEEAGEDKEEEEEAEEEGEALRVEAEEAREKDARKKAQAKFGLVPASSGAKKKSSEGGKIDPTATDKIWVIHADWGLNYYHQFSILRHRSYPQNSPADNGRKLRVGFLSSDLRTHPVSYFIEAPLRYLSSDSIECYCYLSGASGDGRTAQLKQWIPDNRWRHLLGLDAWACADLIREDGIDILVELGGHASGNRMDIMVLKPAPIQVTWIGYPNTTGLPTIDYRITDHIADPYHTQQVFSEQQIRMPEPCAFLCYTPTTSDTPAVGPLPALQPPPAASSSSSASAPEDSKARNYITFCSFNTLAKVTDQVLKTWCEILTKIPNSRMLLKAKPFACALIKAKYLRRFKMMGVNPDRIDVITHVSSRTEHLNLYNRADIALDTFPYAGTTTTCEALYMGVPVLTWRRVRRPVHAQNVGAALSLRIPGLQKFVAHSRAEYIGIAEYFSKNLDELAEVRRNLRENMEKSPICDGALFASKLTQVFRAMWIRHCDDPSRACGDELYVAEEEKQMIVKERLKGGGKAGKSDEKK